MCGRRGGSSMCVVPGSWTDYRMYHYLKEHKSSYIDLPISLHQDSTCQACGCGKWVIKFAKYNYNGIRHIFYWVIVSFLYLFKLKIESKNNRFFSCRQHPLFIVLSCDTTKVLHGGCEATAAAADTKPLRFNTEIQSDNPIVNSKGRRVGGEWNWLRMVRRRRSVGGYIYNTCVITAAGKYQWNECYFASYTGVTTKASAIINKFAPVSQINLISELRGCRSLGKEDVSFLVLQPKQKQRRYVFHPRNNPRGGAGV